MSDAVDAVADALEVEQRTAIAAIDLRQLKLLLDVVYAGGEAPAHGSVLDAVSAMVLHELRARHRFVVTQREKCLVAVLLLIARHHGVDLRLTPVLETERTLARFQRHPDASIRQIREWLASRVLSGDPSQPLVTHGPPPDLRGVVATLGRPIFASAGSGRARDEYLQKILVKAFASRRGQLIVPSRLSPETEPWRTETMLRNDASVRLGKSLLYVALNDEPSSGVGSEISAALQLRMPVILIQSGTRISTRFDPRHVAVLPYGKTPANVGHTTIDWLLRNDWALANSARRRDDRDLLTLRERASLLAAWQQRTEPQRHRLAQVVALSVERIAIILQSAAAFELTSQGILGDLHSALGVDLPRSPRDAPRLNQPEVEALARVTEERGLGVLEAYQASDALLIELAEAGSRRGSLADDDLWRRYFDALGLDGTDTSRRDRRDRDG